MTAAALRTVLGAGAVLLLLGCGRSPQPGTRPAATASASPRLPDAGAAAAAPMVEAPALPAASPSTSSARVPASAPAAAPAPAASASASPSADPEAARRAEQEQRLRAKVEAAKAKAEASTARFNNECPELKPGELRHPGAVAHCNRLHDDAAAALREYEAAKTEAEAAGVSVP